MSERKDHIEVLEKLLKDANEVLLLDIKHENVKDIVEDKSIIETLTFCLASLKVDEAYQLEYEHIPYITLDELKEIREEIEKKIDRPITSHSYDSDLYEGAYTDGLEFAFDVIDKKIFELEGK